MHNESSGGEMSYYGPPGGRGGTTPRGAFGAVVLIVIGLLVYGAVWGGWFNGISVSNPGTSSVSGPFIGGSGSVKGVTAQVPAGMMPCDRINSTANKLCKLAKNYASKRVTDSTQLGCLDKLWNGESGWDPTPGSYNPQNTSGGHAYGIPQALDRLHNFPYKYNDWKAQIDWGLHYIKRTYGNACSAWYKWLARSPHWY